MAQASREFEYRLREIERFRLMVEYVTTGMLEENWNRFRELTRRIREVERQIFRDWLLEDLREHLQITTSLSVGDADYGTDYGRSYESRRVTVEVSLRWDDVEIGQAHASDSFSLDIQ